MKNATVVLEDRSQDKVSQNRDKSTTDDDGVYSVGLAHAPGHFKLTLTVSKQGYESHEEQIETNTYHESHDVILKPTP